MMYLFNVEEKGWFNKIASYETSKYMHYRLYISFKYNNAEEEDEKALADEWIERLNLFSSSVSFLVIHRCMHRLHDNTMDCFTK